MTDVTDTFEDDDRALIGEYLLGLLSPEEEAAVERRLPQDRTLAQLHSDWAEALSPMLAGRDVPAPACLRAEIEARLFRPEPKRSRWWGWAGIVAGPVAAFALAVFLLQPPTGFVPTLNAEMPGIEGSGAGDLYLAAGTDGTDLLIIRRSGEPLPGRVLQLWLIAGDAAPVSLGVLPDQDRVVIPAPAGLTAGVVLAVSDEPPGGSPTGQPTGAVLAAGPLSDL
tara:strand:- start:359 stop:1030 length:672 start_codon:yes stop_codon:yes gene_type:complete